MIDEIQNRIGTIYAVVNVIGYNGEGPGSNPGYGFVYSPVL